MTAKRILPIFALLTLLAMLLSSCAGYQEITQKAIAEVKSSKLLNELAKPEAKSAASNQQRAPIPRESPEKAKITTERVLAKGIPAMKSMDAASESILAPMPYWLQSGSPVAIQDFAHPESGCSWMGIAGQVFDANGNPAPNVVVNVGGTLSWINISLLGLTGTTDVYGPASYEIKISSQPIDSKGTVWVQLSDLSGTAVSHKVNIDTYAACEKNLIIVNFFESPNHHEILLPIVSNGK
mgnify:CR=1 FL=1